MDSPIQAALAELEALSTDLDEAADTLLTAVETALLALAAAKGVDETLHATLAEQFQAIFAGCAFQDLAGQRLTRTRALLTGRPAPQGSLENGPALTGEGLGQSEADTLFATG